MVVVSRPSPGSDEEREKAKRRRKEEGRDEVNVAETFFLYRR
jgi:hypothetical protein